MRLHDEGLIYRGKRLVNWDPVLLTALSDLEVQSEEEDGQLWHLRYPLADGSGSRRGGHHAAGDHARRHGGRGASRRRALPAPHRPAAAPAARRARRFPIIADALRRSGLRLRLRQDHAGARLQRLRDRPAARPAADQHLHPARRAQRQRARSASAGSTASRRASACVAELEAAGLLERDREAPPRGAARRSQRRGARALPHRPVVREDRAARGPGHRARSRQGRTRFVPENWARTYFEWMRNIKDWCVSRQLWWGHRIPAWYDAAGNVYVARERGRGARAAPARRRRSRCARTRTCSTPGSPRRCGRSRRSAGREHDAGAGALLPEQRARDRLRHHLLLGRAHDDDGPEVHGRGAVPRRLHHRPDPRRARRQDVQVQGQRHRPARHRRRHRRSRRWSPSAPAASCSRSSRRRSRSATRRQYPEGIAAARHRCAALHLRRARLPEPRDPLRSGARRPATATSATSCGTPRAS